MPSITPREQGWLDQGEAKGRTVGRTEGRIEGIEVALDIRFGADGLALMPQIRQITDPAVLEQLLRASKSAPDLEAFCNMLPQQPQA